MMLWDMYDNPYFTGDKTKVCRDSVKCSESQSSLVRDRFGIPTQSNISVYTLNDYAMLAFTVPVFHDLLKPIPCFDEAHKNIHAHSSIENNSFFPTTYQDHLSFIFFRL